MSAVPTSAGLPRTASDWEYRLLLGMTYPLFLVGAVLRRVAPRRDGLRAPASLLRDAHDRASRVLPFAFSG